MQEKEFYSLTDVADLLKVRAHRIHYLLANRMVPEPRLRVAGKRLWTLPEIAIISDKLQLQTALEKPEEGVYGK